MNPRVVESEHAVEENAARVRLSGSEDDIRLSNLPARRARMSRFSSPSLAASALQEYRDER